MKGFMGLSMLAAASADSTVSKVIQLLDELKGKVQADLATETEAMESYNKWCETQVTETSYAIKDSKRVISEESAKIEGAQGTIDKSNAAIGELGPAIAGKQQEAAEGQKKREEEHSVFKATEAELVEADDMLRRAYSILKRATNKGGAFLQASDKMNEVIAALGAIVDAAWMQPEKATKIKSFMDDDLSLAQAPQASTSNYDSKSGGILQTIDEMRDQVQADLQAARTAETKGKHANELFQQGAANEVKIFQDQLAQAQSNKATATTKLGNAQKSLKAEQETLAADQAYLQETQHSCADKNSSWEQRQADAAEEMTVLDSAKEVLASKVVVLAQVATSTRRFSDEAIEKRNKVVAMLRRMGHRFNSFGLLQAASSAQADPFAKVRELINNMIAKLEKQAADESSFKETCDKNLKQMRAKKQKKEQAQEKYQTRLTGAQAKSTQNKNLIAKLKGELKALAQAVKEAIAARNKEHADNTKVVDDNKASAAAVAEAINILREFYGSSDKEAFLQKGEAAPGVEFAAAKGDGTHGIIAILETAQADFTKLYEETEAAESQAAADHAKFIQAGEVSKAKKSALIQGKEAENKSLAVQISEINTDLDTTSRELDDVSKALAAEEDRCANKAMSYEERKQRREAELAGLKDALEVLKPDSEE